MVKQYLNSDFGAGGFFSSGQSDIAEKWEIKSPIVRFVALCMVVSLPDGPPDMSATERLLGAPVSSSE